MEAWVRRAKVLDEASGQAAKNIAWVLFASNVEQRNSQIGIQSRTASDCNCSPNMSNRHGRINEEKTGRSPWCVIIARYKPRSSIQKCD